MASKAICQAVFGEEVQGTILAAAFAWSGALQKISKRPTGQAHHFKWSMGSQPKPAHQGRLLPGQDPAGPRRDR